MEQMERLYSENRGLLHYVARRYAVACQGDSAVDMEDLLQAGFIALVKAQAAYDPERGGAWSTVAVQYIKSEMRSALGIRGTRMRAERHAISLDSPIAGNDDISRSDLLQDESLPDIAETVCRKDLQQKVRSAVAGMSDKQASDVIKAHDLEGESLREIGEIMGIPEARIQHIRKKGLKELRADKAIRALADIDDRTQFYRHKGVSAFLSDWTSTTEAAAIWRIEQGMTTSE